MVGEGGRVGVVGDHDDRLAVASSTERRMKPSSSVPEAESRLPVGSSANTIAGLEAIARAAATALLLAAGQLGRLVGQALAQPDGVDHRVDLARSGLRPAMAWAQLDVLGRGQGREQVEGLEHEADLVLAEQGELLLGRAC